jgi:hypothetical protein
MTVTAPLRTWSVAPASVDSAEALALLRDYYVEVADRYRQLHLRRAEVFYAKSLD